MVKRACQALFPSLPHALALPAPPIDRTLYIYGSGIHPLQVARLGGARYRPIHVLQKKNILFSDATIALPDLRESLLYTHVNTLGILQASAEHTLSVYTCIAHTKSIQQHTNPITTPELCVSVFYTGRFERTEFLGDSLSNTNYSLDVDFFPAMSYI